MGQAGRPITMDLTISGMDCQNEVNRIEANVGALDGVSRVQALLSVSRATVTFDPGLVDFDRIRAAIAEAGCGVVGGGGAGGLQDEAQPGQAGPGLGAGSGLGADPGSAAGRSPATGTAPDPAQLVGMVALAAVAALVVGAAIGERLGLLDGVLERLPWWVPAAALALGGWKVFRGVVRAGRRAEVTGHTLMAVGVIASAAIGQWTTAALIVFFMRFADWLEERTMARSRAAIQALVGLAPATARVLRDGREQEVPVARVRVGDLTVVRPGERIPVDGLVAEGAAPVDQAAITGESVPVDKGPGDRVFAATVAQAGHLRITATEVGHDTTFARVIRLVEEAEASRAQVQRFADRFAAVYLPVVLLLGGLTWVATQSLTSAVAVLVVACACAITMATPVVVLASVGNAARNGLLVKGGAALESLARVDAVVMDKTGTVTHGRPRVTDVVPLDGGSPDELLRVAGAVEARSEHPLARAIVDAATDRGLALPAVAEFRALPGLGVIGTVEGRRLVIGNRRLLSEAGIPADAPVSTDAAAEARADQLEAAGRTVFLVARDGRVVGLVGLADTVRPGVREALAELRDLGVRDQVLLTGDSEAVAAAVAGELGIRYRAGLLPEDKIAAVRELQAAGRTVLFVGDGINDAPALAQANVGMAMGAAGSAAAVEAAHVTLLRDDWALVPAAVRLGRRGLGTIRQNLAFAAAYNVVGIGLAAMGVLPPVWAAAAQSLPDVAIMLNSARLIRARITGR